VENCRHQTELVALVFTDLVDSVALRRQLRIKRPRACCKPPPARPRYLARFPDAGEIETAAFVLLLLARPSDAVKFAVLIQRQTRALASERGLRLAVRMGIHVKW
jgi:class 3 adenylate cyclase